MESLHPIETASETIPGVEISYRISYKFLDQATWQTHAYLHPSLSFCRGYGLSSKSLKSFYFHQEKNSAGFRDLSLPPPHQGLRWPLNPRMAFRAGGEEAHRRETERGKKAKVYVPWWVKAWTVKIPPHASPMHVGRWNIPETRYSRGTSHPPPQPQQV